MKKSILLSLILISGIFFGCNMPSVQNIISNELDDNNISNEGIINDIQQNIEESFEQDIEIYDTIINQKPINNESQVHIFNEAEILVSPVEKLAKCLSEKGAKMYGSKTCPYCLKQEEMFGENFKYINYINCMEQPELCGGISGVPAWEFMDGNKKSGLQSFESLAIMAGCEYSS